MSLQFLLLTIQCLGIIGVFLEALIVIRRWKNNLHTFLLFSCIAALINGTGYLLEMQAKTTESFITATQFSYFGREWYAFFLLLFTAELVRITIPSFIKYLFVFLQAGIYAVILTIPVNKLYYSWVKIESHGTGYRFSHGNGPVHHINMALQIIYIAIGLFWLIRACLHCSESKEKRRLLTVILAIISQSVFFIIQIVGISGITDYYDVTMIGYFIATILMFVAIFSFDLLGASEIAKEFVIDRLSEIIVAVDNNGTVQYFNEPAAQVYPQIRIGLNISQIPDRLKDLISDKSSVTIGDRIYSPEENELLYNDEKVGMLYVLADDTEHFQYMKELKKQRAIADSANRAKSTFLSNMSHEIRTPINAVLGMNEMILRESMEAETLQYAESVRTAGNTLLGLINDILDFSKIEAGKMEIIPVEYPLSSALNDLVNMTQARADAKDLEFIVEVNPGIPNKLYGDEIRIKQIVTNILTNAVKYTKQGSVKLSVDYETDTDDMINLRFTVADTGIGIKPENIDKLFTAFERIEEERNRSIEGTGLGMSITHRLVTLMDGNIHVDSEYGKGSVFAFSIRQKVVETTPIGSFREAMQRSLSTHRIYHERFTAPDANVLVVDDTEMNLVVFKGLLKKTKLKIDTARSGFVCLKKCEDMLYDLIFLDHRMPDKDGIETLQDLRKINEYYANVPVICLTANAISGAKEEYLAAGFTDYLTKPVDADALEQMIMRLLPAKLVHACDSPKDSSRIVAPVADDYIVEAQKIYVEGIEDTAAEIEKYYNNEDWTNYTVKVHALKSSSRLIGEEELGSLAEKLELAGDSLDIATIRDNNEALLAMYRALSDKYSYLLANDNDSSADDTPVKDKEPITEAQWNEALMTIRELSSAFDSDSIESVMEMLNEYSLSEEQTELIDDINKALLKIDWDGIKEMLKFV